MSNTPPSERKEARKTWEKKKDYTEGGIKSPRASRWREKITEERDLVKMSAGISSVGIQVHSRTFGKELFKQRKLRQI
jgi:hypothetical protein